MISVLRALGNVLAVAMPLAATTVHAAEVKLIVSAAVKEAVIDLIPAFEKESGHKISTTWPVLRPSPSESVAARWLILSSSPPLTSLSGNLPPSATTFAISPGVLASGERYVFHVMLREPYTLSR